MSSSNILQTSCLVIGSGAGGMTTAITLARAGMHVTLVEEGFSKSSSDPFSLQELRSDYRSGGQILTIGPHPINLGEGCLLGGGTAINTGYYLRPQSGKLENLAANWKINEFSEKHLHADFEAIEAELCPKYLDGSFLVSDQDWLRASQACHLTAERAQFIHTWNQTAKILERRSLFDLWGEELESSLGVKVISGCRIRWIRQIGQKWVASGVSQNDTEISFESSFIFVCAGALESASLLRKSGITKNIGNNLKFHIFLRVMAKFHQTVNKDRCPIYSWKAFNDRLTIGHSPDYLHLMALAFPEMLEELKSNGENWSSFYASIPSVGRRWVRPVLMSQQPLAFSSLAFQEKQYLTQAFDVLQSFLKELGVVETYPQSPSFRFLQSVHLFGTNPMGEDVSRCATDSWGRVHGYRGLYVNDASLMGTSVGQNPQATIMAIARRNSRHFLSEANI